MFGYVRPLKAELRVREMDDYQAVYCGLCRTMAKRHGFLSRFTLNYDFTFLALILAFEPDSGHFFQCRCPAHPFRKRKTCQVMPSLEVAADESLILSYQKLRDDVADHSFWRGIPARLAVFALKSAYRKAAKARAEFDRLTTGCLNELSAMEKEQCLSMDRPADAFARILKAAAPDTGNEARNRALSQVLYHVGRWIYLIDAWDDMEEDILAERYNPINARFQGSGVDHVQEIRTTLLHSRNLAASAYELAKAAQWDGILSNIIYLGLPMVEDLVFSGKWKRNRKVRRINE